MLRAPRIPIHLVACALLAGTANLAQAQAQSARPVGADSRPAQPPTLSPRCAEMIEAIRSGAARGMERTALLQLHEAFRQQCGDDAARARGLLVEERNRQRDVREREERTARLELDRDKLNREQCAEMKRILQTRRQRLEAMTAGERGDFERFEATWRARCTP